MTDTIKNELNYYFNHIVENRDTHKISSQIEAMIMQELLANGFVSYGTPFIHHGIHEYDAGLAEVLIDETSPSRAFLRQSAQFEKQLIVLAGQTPYFQKSFCFRPGENGKFHVPYHNQIDTEMPFNLENISHEQAQQQVTDMLIKLIKKSLKIVDKEIESITTLTYKQALEEYGNDSPFIEPKKSNGVNLAIVINPPLLKDDGNGKLQTVIHPMAQPILSEQAEARFASGDMDREEMSAINVYGYDIIASSNGIFEEQDERVG